MRVVFMGTPEFSLAPLAASLMTGWVLLYGWAVLRNEVAETVPTFLWRVTRIGRGPDRSTERAHPDSDGPKSRLGREKRRG